MNSYGVRHATSAGGLVFDDRDDGRWVVLIAHKSARGEIQWTLPKGGIDEGETLVQTAVREVREETGLDAQVKAKLGVIDYWFVWRPDKIRYHKYVHYFLLQFLGGSFDLRDQEAEDVVWLPITEALDLMHHPSEIRIVRKAIDVYGKNIGKTPAIPQTLRPIIPPASPLSAGQDMYKPQVESAKPSYILKHTSQINPDISRNRE